MAEALVLAGQDDHHAVADVDRLADDGGVVGGLTGLDLAVHQTVGPPVAGALWILHQPEDLVGGLVECLHGARFEAFLQIGPVTVPVAEGDLMFLLL